MVKNKWSGLLLISLILSMDILGQDNRYMVFFTDKQNSGFSINSPEAYLSPKAIARRQKNQAAISETDLPVNGNYIKQVSDLGINVFHQSKWLNAVLIETSEDKLASINNLAITSSVEFVAPGSKLSGRSDRKNKFEQTTRVEVQNGSNGVDATDMQNRMLDVTLMHDLGYQGQEVMIGVFDGGFLGADTQPHLKHIFDDNRIVATYDFVNNVNNVYTIDNHGTRAFSCIGAFTEGKIIGTAPQAKFVLCISEQVETEYRVEEYNWIFAAEFADSIGVDVISTSLGYNTFDDPTMDYNVGDMDGKTAVISTGAQLAADKGILLVNSAGNLGNDLTWLIIAAPADVDDIITVGAIQADSTKSIFSSIGPTADGRVKPDVVALGTNTIVGFDEASDRPVFSSGTSFSAPLVAGLSAGLIQAFPEKSKDEILQMIRDSGHQATAADNLTGYGIPSFIRASNFVVEMDDDLKNEILLFPNPAGKAINLQFKKQSKDAFSWLQVYNYTGKIVYSTNIISGSGNNQLRINLENLSDGLYVLKLSGDHNQLTCKFLKH